MSFWEALILLFTDSLVVGLFLPPRNPTVFPVMHIFSTYPAPLLVGVALMGVMVASLGNLCIGRMLMRVFRFDVSHPKIEKMVAFLRGKGVVLLVFSWIPMIGPMLVVVYGVVMVSIRRAMVIILVGQIFYYCGYIILFPHS